MTSYAKEYKRVELTAVHRGQICFTKMLRYIFVISLCRSSLVIAEPASITSPQDSDRGMQLQSLSDRLEGTRLVRPHGDDTPTHPRSFVVSERCEVEYAI